MNWWGIALVRRIGPRTFGAFADVRGRKMPAGTPALLLHGGEVQPNLRPEDFQVCLALRF